MTRRYQLSFLSLYLVVMRVVHAIWTLHPTGGGPPTALRGLAKAQAALGMQVGIIAMHRPGMSRGDQGDLKRAGIEVEIVGPAYTPLLWHPQLPAVMRETVASAGVVHIHGIWEEIVQ